MPDTPQKPEGGEVRSDKPPRELMKKLIESRAVDFERIGDIVKTLPETSFDPSVTADDYVVTGYSSVIKVWKTSFDALGLEEVSAVRELNQRVKMLEKDRG